MTTESPQRSTNPHETTPTKWVASLGTVVPRVYFCAEGKRKLEMVDVSQVLRFNGAVKRDTAIDAWMHNHSNELAAIASRWFEVMRECGEDVRELLHDGHPTACIGDAAFGYVNAFRTHVNVGFFRGAEIADPDRLLEGTGKFMRHVKLRPDTAVDSAALTRLIKAAYADMQKRIEGL